MTLNCLTCGNPIPHDDLLAQLMIEMGFGTLCETCELRQLKTLPANTSKVCTTSTRPQQTHENTPLWATRLNTDPDFVRDCDNFALAYDTPSNPTPKTPQKAEKRQNPWSGALSGLLSIVRKALSHNNLVP